MSNLQVDRAALKRVIAENSTSIKDGLQAGRDISDLTFVHQMNGQPCAVLGWMEKGDLVSGDGTNKFELPPSYRSYSLENMSAFDKFTAGLI